MDSFPSTEEDGDLGDFSQRGCQYMRRARSALRLATMSRHDCGTAQSVLPSCKLQSSCMSGTSVYSNSLLHEAEWPSSRSTVNISHRKQRGLVLALCPAGNKTTSLVKGAPGNSYFESLVFLVLEFETWSHSMVDYNSE